MRQRKKYVDGEFLKFIIEVGILIDPSSLYILCLKDVSERVNMSLRKMAVDVFLS